MVQGLSGWSSLARALRDDVRFGLRSMRKSPRFFALVLLVAVLSVGATTAMASVLQATLLRPLPYPAPDRLVMLWSARPGEDQLQVSLPDFFDWQRQAQSFEKLALVHSWGFSVSNAAVRPQLELGMLVSGDYFPLLGIQPLLGRLLGPEDARPDQPCRLVLSEALFRSRFGSDPALIESSIELDGKPCRVVGVAERGFEFGYPRYMPASLWVPLHTSWPLYALKSVSMRDEHEFHVLGRLRPRVSLEQARDELSALAARIGEAHPGHAPEARVTGLHEEVTLQLRPKVLGLFSAIAIAFLAACSNIGSLFLVRMRTRRSELALRGALGATRGRLARQLMIETALVFAVAAPAAWLASRWFVELFSSIAASSLLDAAEVHVDNGVLLPCLLLSSATGALFGLGPALASSRGSPGLLLAEAGTQTGGSRNQRRMGSVLVVAQVCAACALAATSSTALRAVAELLRRPAGIDVTGVISARVAPQQSLYSDDALPGLYDRLVTGLRARPEVRTVSLVNATPLAAQAFWANIQRPPPNATNRQRFIASVAVPGYLGSVSIPISSGRDFNADDTAHAPPVILISQTLRSSLFGEADPVGQYVLPDLWENTQPMQVIGVVGDVRRFGLQEAPGNEAYLPFAQHPMRSMTLVLRVDPARADALTAQLPAWLDAIEPRLPLGWVSSQTGSFEQTLERELVLSRLLTWFAAVCVALATLGIYSALSYAAAQRTREVGIRAALGASPWNIVWVVTSAGLRWVGAGLLLALGAVLLLGRGLSQQIAGAPAFDPGSFALAAGAVGVAALAACILPALRALAVPPAHALRRD